MCDGVMVVVMSNGGDGGGCRVVVVEIKVVFTGSTRILQFATCAM